MKCMKPRKAIPRKRAKMKRRKIRVRFKCAHCGKLTAGRLPRGVLVAVAILSSCACLVAIGYLIGKHDARLTP